MLFGDYDIITTKIKKKAFPFPERLFHYGKKDIIS